MSITVTNLSKNYGTQKAVNNISFNVDRGEIVGFLGPNGAGKSTTMKMITGYLSPDGGEIKVAGVKAGEQATETKQKIGYLPEANPLYTDMYVREYLSFIAGIHHVDNSSKVISDIIETVGLSSEAHKKIAMLSKGYKQRVGLAAAFLHDPEVLILDEPTSGLDPNQIVEIRNVIKALSKNKTVLFSSHILQEVEAICDRVIIIHKGNIVANDSLADLRAKHARAAVSVSFKEVVSVSEIEKVKGAGSVIKSESGFIINSENPEALRRSLLSHAVEKGWNIVSLQNESSSLEDVFRKLTS